MKKITFLFIATIFTLSFIFSVFDVSADVTNPDFWTKECKPGEEEVKCSYTNKEMFGSRRPGECDKYTNNPDYYLLVMTGSTWGGRERYCKKVVIRDLSKERKAIGVFGKVYAKLPSNSNDWQAIKYIAYGIMPLQRDLAQERVAISKFIKIYKKLPSVSYDWNIVRAIAYGGVISFDELKNRGQSVSLEDLKKDPAKYYGKEIVVRGYVKELKRFIDSGGEYIARECFCFALTSVKTSKEYITDQNKTLKNVWYDMMIKEDGTPLPAADVSGIKNNDLVDVFGEFKGENDLWVKALKKL